MNSYSSTLRKLVLIPLAIFPLIVAVGLLFQFQMMAKRLKDVEDQSTAQMKFCLMNNNELQDYVDNQLQLLRYDLFEVQEILHMKRKR